MERRERRLAALQSYGGGDSVRVMNVNQGFLNIFLVAVRHRRLRSNWRRHRFLAQNVPAKPVCPAVIVGTLLLVVSDPAGAIQIHDDFSSGVGTWIAGQAWSLYNPSPGNYYYRADYNGSGDTITWKNTWALDS